MPAFVDETTMPLSPIAHRVPSPQVPSPQARRRPLTAWLLALATVMAAGPALAQALVPGGPAAAPVTNERPDTVGTVPATPAKDSFTHFGARLFQGAQPPAQPSGLSPTYRIAPGDEVAVNLYGAVTSTVTQPVDN